MYNNINEKHKFSIWYNEKEDRWYSQLPDETKPNGRRKIKKKHKEDLDAAINAFYEEQESEDSRTFENLFYEFMDYKKPQVSSETIKRMMADWNKFYKSKIEFIKLPFKSITKIDVDSFFNQTVAERTLKDSAFKNMCGILKQTFEYAVDAEYIEKSPYRVKVNKKKIITTRKKPSEKEVFSFHEQDLITEEMERRLKENPSNTVPFAVLLDFEIGVRLGEMLGFRKSDIKDGKIHVQRQLVKQSDITDIDKIKCKGWKIVEYTKSDCGDRWIPLTDKAINYIERIVETNEKYGKAYEDYLFITDDNTIITEDAVSGQLKRGCQNVGIPVRRMHKIRKTYASKLYRNGVSISIISKLLGHADETTTLKHYIFSLEESDEIDDIVLNALQEPKIKPIDNRVNARDKNIIQFPTNKKTENPSKIKVFRH